MAKTSRVTVTAYTLFVALKELCIALISGTNLDTSTYSIPVASTSTDGALEAGGNLAAIAASASVLDDWDETNRLAANVIAGQIGVAGGSGAADALTQRVITATDSLEITRLTSLVTALAPTTLMGIAGVRFTSADQSAADAPITSAPTGGQKLVVENVLISVADAQTILLKEETSGTVLATFYMAALSHVIYDCKRLKLATADKKLTIRASASGNIAATALYHSEA